MRSEVRVVRVPFGTLVFSKGGPARIRLAPGGAVALSLSLSLSLSHPERMDDSFAAFHSQPVRDPHDVRGSWVLVTGPDPVSRAQTDVCRALRSSAVVGAVACDDDANRGAPLCAAVSQFPAFCHQTTRKCVYGFRGTAEALARLDAAPGARQ